MGMVEKQLEAWALDLMMNAEPLKCQGKHQNPHVPECTIEVTHRVRTCEGARVICEATAWSNLIRIQTRGDQPCNPCGTLIKDCWEVWPI